MLDVLINLARSRNFWLVLFVLTIAFAIYLVGHRWKPETQLRMKQSATLVAIESGSHRRLSELVSENYADPWGFKKPEVITAFRELRAQFLVIGVESGEMQLEINEDEAIVTTNLALNGSGPSPVAALIVNEANRLNAPFVFTWKKEDGKPWSWKLIRVENADLSDLRGYQPGQFESYLDTF